MCSVHSLPLFKIFSPFFCPLIIDPFGRAVPFGPDMDRLVTGTQPVTPTGMLLGTGTLRTEDVGPFPQENRELSVLGEDFDSTPMVFPSRAHFTP